MSNRPLFLQVTSANTEKKHMINIERIVYVRECSDGKTAIETDTDRVLTNEDYPSLTFRLLDLLRKSP